MNIATKTIYFEVKSSDDSGLMRDTIFPSEWQLKTLSSSKEQLDYYDTFEWNAFEKEAAIVKTKKSLSLVDLNTGHKTVSVAFSRNPSFFSLNDLPSGKLKDMLTTYSDIRAFIRLCSVHTFLRSYHILDDNEKTIGVLTSTSLYFADKKNQKPFASFLSIIPLRGYQETIEKAVRYNSDGSVLDFKELFLLIMTASGQNVQGYSSKIKLDLDADASIHESTQQLLRFTLSILRKNEYGIRNNIDTEFLHDYRVAIRRTRSILKQLTGVYDSEDTALYLNAFKELAKQTNQLRDSDVYLLQQKSYFNYLPPFLQQPLKLFFSDIAASRKKLHKKFCLYLASGAYQTLLEEWNLFVHQESFPDSKLAPPNASLSTMTVAVGTIKKAWKKVIRHGRQISRETTDAELHALRIDCKKLRYLLEFFSSIFPHKTITPVIRKMKELQENLGDFVDFAVQLQFLHERLTVVSVSEKDCLYAASLGGLMTTLFQKQEEARQKFHETFLSFDNEETALLFSDLLSGASS
ncbi:MAG: CHAD domain-containing protein [Chlorobiaceae bacterium]